MRLEGGDHVLGLTVLFRRATRIVQFPPFVFASPPLRKSIVALNDVSAGSAALMTHIDRQSFLGGLTLSRELHGGSPIVH